MKFAALLIASALTLAACSSGEIFVVEITVDPIYAKDGTIIDPRATVMAPAGMN